MASSLLKFLLFLCIFQKGIEFQHRQECNMQISLRDDSSSLSPQPFALSRGLNGHANTATIARVTDAVERREFKSIYPLEMCQYCLLRRDFMEILDNRKLRNVESARRKEDCAEKKERNEGNLLNKHRELIYGVRAAKLLINFIIRLSIAANKS